MRLCAVLVFFKHSKLHKKHTQKKTVPLHGWATHGPGAIKGKHEWTSIFLCVASLALWTQMWDRDGQQRTRWVDSDTCWSHVLLQGVRVKFSLLKLAHCWEFWLPQMISSAQISNSSGFVQLSSCSLVCLGCFPPFYLSKEESILSKSFNFQSEAFLKALTRHLVWPSCQHQLAADKDLHLTALQPPRRESVSN